MENLQGGTIALEHRYQVLERVDETFLTTLYRSKQDPFNKRVWLKVFAPFLEAGAEDELFEYLKAYAHRSGQIDAPGVLRTLDYGELEQNVPFVITERARGTSLAEVLKESDGLPASDVIELVERIADVLEQVHVEGYVHGFLVPEWVYLPDRDYSAATISHFQLGLALYDLMATNRDAVGEEVFWSMPPELIVTLEGAEQPDQLQLGDNFSIAGDVFALSVLTYRALTGHSLVGEERSNSEIMDLEWERAETPVHGDICDIVEWGLSEDPAARPSSVKEFAAGLREAADLSDEAEDSAEPAGGAENREMARVQSERDPGPSDLLMTLLLFLLVVSNFAWFFWGF